MKRSLSTILGASALALALAAPGASAGFFLHDYVLKPVISAAKILPPEPAEPAEPAAPAAQVEADGSAIIRLSGQFCPHPNVYQGNTAGEFDMLFLDSNDAHEIYAEMSESEPGVTYKIGVTCHLIWGWHVAAIDVTVPPETDEPDDTTQDDE